MNRFRGLRRVCIHLIFVVRIVCVNIRLLLLMVDSIAPLQIPIRTMSLEIARDLFLVKFMVNMDSFSMIVIA